MNAREVVVEMVRAMGAATCAQVHAELGGRFTIKQVSSALRDATVRELLVTTRKHVPGTCVIQATYRIKPPTVAWLRYPSVWHYGQGVAV